MSVQKRAHRFFSFEHLGGFSPLLRGHKEGLGGRWGKEAHAIERCWNKAAGKSDCETPTHCEQKHVNLVNASYMSRNGDLPENARKSIFKFERHARHNMA